MDAYPHSNFCRGSDSLSVGSEEVDQGPWCTRLLRLDLSTRRVPGTVTGGPTVEVTAMACLPPPTEELTGRREGASSVSRGEGRASDARLNSSVTSLSHGAVLRSAWEGVRERLGDT